MDEAAQPPVIDGERLGNLLRRYAMAVHRLSLAMGKALDMPPTDVWAMEHLMTSGALGPVELGHRLGIRSASATTLVDRLERAGHVERRRHDADRRRLVVVPTEQGVATALGAFAAVGEALDGAADDLTASERAAVARYLERVTAALETYSDTQD